MNSGTIKLAFGNNEYDFCLCKHKQVDELQDLCGSTAKGADGEIILIPAGPLQILNRLRGENWRESDVHAVLRLGLIGGGMPVQDALKLIRAELMDQPIAPHVPTAVMVMIAAVYGVPKEAPIVDDAA